MTGREAGDRPGAQVVAVGEAAGHDHHVDAVQVPVAVPEDHRLPGPLGGELSVHLVAGPREADDPELHAARVSASPVATIS